MSSPTKAISDECAAVVFYGIDQSAKAAEGFYSTMIKVLNGLDIPPDKLAITGPGHSGKLLSFARGNAKLQKTGFRGVTDLEVVSSLEDAQRVRDYFVTSEWSADYSYSLIVARSSLATLSNSSMLPIARILAIEVKPEYGIGYKVHRDSGPEWYAVGIGYSSSVEVAASKVSGQAYEDSLARCRWGDAMKERVWLKGILRDVYPWNFLTKPQLSKKIGGVSLQKWINQDPRRGALTALCDGVDLWGGRRD